MTRATNNVATKARHKKILKMAKGYRGRHSKNFTLANEKVEKGLQFAYRDRRDRKSEFRKLWIIRINAATRLHGMCYSAFMNGLKLGGIELDRKVLADLAVKNSTEFTALVEQARRFTKVPAHKAI
jgi:large subunit ribosomal protein L20